MIVRILSKGRSFQGCATYLAHDAEADTAERVGWTHTLNCANDHVPSAVNEMVWTARDAELLKQEAGIRAGGRPTENTVKHLSLNWAPDEQPSREHMIATTEDYLRHMGWDEHQAVLVAHTDKSYAHVHVMLNTIHPETGLKLDENFERRRAQEWAKGYEREHGIHCEQRLQNIGEREPSPTRPAWMTFQGVRQDFEEKEKSRAAAADRITEINPELTGTQKEWQILKQMQRDERLAFFAEGKLAFSEMRNSVYREVREEFREGWSNYYTAQKNGADVDTLKEMKATLVEQQKTILEERRDDAYRGLRETRDGLYQELLAGQREKRQALTSRQSGQFESLDYMDWFRTETPRDRAADARAAPASDLWGLADADAESASYGSGIGSGVRSGADAGSRLLDGFADRFLKIFELAADAFSPPTAPPPPPAPVDDYFAKAAVDARLRTQIDRDRGPALEEEEEQRARARPQQ